MPSASPTTISPEALASARSLRDLLDPRQGPHAMQRVGHLIVDHLASRWGSRLEVVRTDPVVTVADNYDNLHYPPDGAARDVRYTRYVSSTTLLRTQTSAMIPPTLRSWGGGLPGGSCDVLCVCPGLVYRRETIDKLHTGEPHQMDLWRIREGSPLTTEDLRKMVEMVVHAVLPKSPYRCNPAVHPYTMDGLEIEVEVRGQWVEIGECGLALPAILQEAGLDPLTHSGLAMGLGMDRLLMLRKGIDDIRLLRSTDPRVTSQMWNLNPYKVVSRQPPIRRDLSIAVAADTTPEELGDRVRGALGVEADSVEVVRVLTETSYEDLPLVARERIGMSVGQKNVLLEVVISNPSRTLTSQEGNDLRDRIYAALHEGSVSQWCR